MQLNCSLHPHQFLHIILMVLTLGAVQVVQASPLHDHSRDTVGCALCHMPVIDDPGAQSLPIPIFTQQCSAINAQSVPATQSGNPSPYQGRAPPLAFL